MLTSSVASYRASFDGLLRFIRSISLFRAPCVGVRQVGVQNCGPALVSLIITHFITSVVTHGTSASFKILIIKPRPTASHVTISPATKVCKMLSSDKNVKHRSK